MPTSTTTSLDTLYEPFINQLVLFITKHAMLWFILLLIIVAIVIISFLAKFIPQLELFKSKIILPVSKKIKQKRLIRAAIKSDIKSHINLQVKNFQQYLPKGWFKEIDIDWICSENERQFIEDNRVVLRLRPTDCQHRNFVNSTYHFLKQILFPKTNNVVPELHLEGTLMYLCKKIIENKSQETMTIFEDEYLEPSIQKHKKLPQYLSDYETIDKKGFFLGMFLRELHTIAMEVRFTPDRSKISNETAGVIKHIKEFIKKYDEEGSTEIPSSLWYNLTNISKYGLLLVAHPVKASLGIDVFINRAREKVNNGANRVYVFGTINESNFFNTVVCGIDNLAPELELVEKFVTPTDYRGNPNGLGAVFSKKK